MVGLACRNTRAHLSCAALFRDAREQPGRAAGANESSVEGGAVPLAAAGAPWLGSAAQLATRVSVPLVCTCLPRLLRAATQPAGPAPSHPHLSHLRPVACALANGDLDSGQRSPECARNARLPNQASNIHTYLHTYIDRPVPPRLASPHPDCCAPPSGPASRPGRSADRPRATNWSPALVFICCSPPALGSCFCLGRGTRSLLLFSPSPLPAPLVNLSGCFPHRKSRRMGVSLGGHAGAGRDRRIWRMRWPARWRQTMAPATPLQSPTRTRTPQRIRSS